MMKEELIRQKGVVSTRRNILAESKVLKQHPYLVEKDDLSSTTTLEDVVEHQIKQIMVNKEDNNRIFLILHFDIKDSITSASIRRSSISRIDITQQDGSIVAETTKEGIGRHLLERNRKLYRSSGLSPFGDTELGRQLGPLGT
jgi:Mg2+/Co2+ transporter CorB